ncbi:hypothetical protein AVEN_257394-1 [Araneus ventricosus]|uniref:PiggyBac transposable element-derived protein domain-containing protein n=1 Tax=Araneus ventricosus TaxID=182803 RepID=A0A4Y2UZX4_ARAVE|nr:hypothetical protein AVEN_257394-1 [Araneus ventricosus]
MPTQCEKEMERLSKVLAEVETDEDPVFDNGSEDVLEEDFSDHERFSELDTESEENGDSGNEDVNKLLWFSSKDGVQRRKTKFRQNIRNRYHNTVSRLLGTKGPAKYLTSPVKSWEISINDNMIELIVE